MEFLKKVAITILGWISLAFFGICFLIFVSSIGIFVVRDLLKPALKIATHESSHRASPHKALELVLPPKHFRTLISDEEARSNPLSKECNSKSHPSLCHEVIKDRLVRIDMYDGAGSGTVYQANGDYAIIVTARHVIERSHEKIESSIMPIQTAYGHKLEPLLTCISPKKLTDRSNIEIGTDLGIIIAKAPGYQMPRLGHDAHINGTATIGEYAGASPNTQAVLALMKSQAEIQTIPSLWTGASGSGIFDLSGKLVGIFVASTDHRSGLKVGVGVSIPKLNSRFFRSMVSDYECFNQAIGEPLVKNDFTKYHAARAE